MRHVTNAISAAERKCNSSQLQDIATHVGESMGNVTSFPWAAIAFAKETSDIGAAIKNVKDNKIAIFLTQRATTCPTLPTNWG